MLTPPAARGALVAPALWDGEPLERSCKRVAPAQHHPRERGRHLRPKCDPAPSLVLKVVQLDRHVLSRLALVELDRLEDGRVVLLEPVQPGALAPRLEQPRAKPHLLWVEVSRPPRWVELEALLLASLGGLVALRDCSAHAA
eukprot:scaffold31970_cov31-Tisochrysis_lutea.AAC.1